MDFTNGEMSSFNFTTNSSSLSSTLSFLNSNNNNGSDDNNIGIFDINIPNNNNNSSSSSSSSNSNSNNNSNNSSRKGSSSGKGVGIDLEKMKKSREEQSIQLRKDKRLDTINKHRMRVTEADSDDAGTVNVYNGIDLNALNNYRAILESDDYDQQLEGAIHFRKMLATDKNPPIDLVIRSGAVPRLLQLLDQRRDKNRIQIEISWSLTNLACGEQQHIVYLISLGVTAIALNIITSNCDDRVRDQLLWAISNLTSDAKCKRQFINEGLVDALSLQLGIGLDTELAKLPSLSTMHHIASICINLLRPGTPYPIQTRFQIILIVCELLQSPDFDCVSDVNKALYFLCTDSSENVTLLLEQGAASRLRDLCDKSENRESSLKTLAAMINSSSPFHRRILLSDRFRGIINLFLNEILEQSSYDDTRIEIISALSTIGNNEYKYLIPYMDRILYVALELSQRDNFACNVKLGNLISTIVQTLTADQLRLYGLKLVQIIWLLLHSLNQAIPPDLLVFLLFSLKKIAEWTLIEGIPIIGIGFDMETIKDYVSNFISYPNQDVVTIASQLDRVLDQNFFTENANGNE